MTDEKNNSGSRLKGPALWLLTAACIGGLVWAWDNLGTESAKLLVREIEQAPERFVVKGVPSPDGEAGVPDAKAGFLVGHNPDVQMTAGDIIITRSQLPALCVEKQNGSYEIFFPYQFNGDLAPRARYHKDPSYKRQGNKLNRMGFCEQARSLSTL